MKFDEASKLIESAQNILLTTHTRPDGDAVGSLAALKHLIEQSAQRTSRNCSAELLFLSRVPDNYKFLLNDIPYLSIDEQITRQQIEAQVCPPAPAAQVQPPKPPADCPVEQVNQRAKGAYVPAESPGDERADNQDGPRPEQRPAGAARSDGRRKASQRIEPQEHLNRLGRTEKQQEKN